MLDASVSDRAARIVGGLGVSGYPSITPLAAGSHTAAGMPDRAIQWLSIAMDRGFINYPFLAYHDPFLKPLRTDSRCRQLVAAVGERWEKVRAVARLRERRQVSRCLTRDTPVDGMGHGRSLSMLLMR